MTITNEQVVFNIPSLSTEWIFPAQLYFDINNERYYVCSEEQDTNESFMCNFCIYHTIIGDIHKFNVTFHKLSKKYIIIEWVLEIILSIYCKENLIELNFEKVNYE